MTNILHRHIPIFRIFYSTTFTLFSLVLAALILITPGDHIYQSLQAGQLYHIIIVGAVYVLTFILAVFIYASRLFSTRSALAGIPREWNLNGNRVGDPGIGLGMGQRMGKVVREGLERSAIIAYEGRPRDLRGEEQVKHIPTKRKRRRPAEGEERQGSVESNAEPVWGTISHAGWASPESPDLPNLHFEPVILELGHLIEAKAVSLAPVDPLWEEAMGNEEIDDAKQSSAPPPPNPLVVELLRRPSAMSLREYVAHLTALGMIAAPTLGTDFVVLYERARFSGDQLEEVEFRNLMTVFAEILRNMLPLDQRVLEGLHATAEDLPLNDGKIDAASEEQSLASNATTKHTPLLHSHSHDSSVDSPSNTHATAQAAPSRPESTHTRSRASSSRQLKSASVLRNERKASLVSLRSSISHPSRSTDSLTASSAGSVIRLAEARTSLDLPYTFVDGTREEI